MKVIIHDLGIEYNEKLQKKCDVLLICAWNYKGEEGNIPGKLYDSLALKKPVLCYVCAM